MDPQGAEAIGNWIWKNWRKLTNLFINCYSLFEDSQCQMQWIT